MIKELQKIMNHHTQLFFSIFILNSFLLGSCSQNQPEKVNGNDAPLANHYPNDVGIENDSHVLYVENFDDGMENILSRYTDIQNPEGMSLDADVPTGSLGPNSFKMTNIGGQNTGGHLFRNFDPGFDSTIYIRYYVKYPLISKGYIHHESVWLGGFNPPSTCPSMRRQWTLIFTGAI